MSLRAAIDAKCRECIYDPLGGQGNWRQQVDKCTSYSCPLYRVRPRSKSRSDSQKVANLLAEPT